MAKLGLRIFEVTRINDEPLPWNFNAYNLPSFMLSYVTSSDQMRKILHELGYTRTEGKLTKDNFFRYEGDYPYRWLSREMEISSTDEITIHVLSTERRKQEAIKIARKLEEKIIEAGKAELSDMQKGSYEAQQLLKQLPVLAQS